MDTLVQGTATPGGAIAARRSGAAHPRVGYTGPMASKRTIDQLLAVVRAEPSDMAARLELADLYARAGDLPNALAMYEEVASCYARRGFPLKALALYKQLCSMVVAGRAAPTG